MSVFVESLRGKRGLKGHAQFPTRILVDAVAESERCENRER